jgi:tRNA(fMet)-specific endonuclease VapC
VNIAEIYHGAYKAGWGQTRLNNLKGFLQNFVIVPFSNDICLEWAKIQSEADKNGNPIGDSDCWIAACARYYGYPIATHNIKHFQFVRGIQLIFPKYH